MTRGSETFFTCKRFDLPALREPSSKENGMCAVPLAVGSRKRPSVEIVPSDMRYIPVKIFPWDEDFAAGLVVEKKIELTNLATSGEKVIIVYSDGCWLEVDSGALLNYPALLQKISFVHKPVIQLEPNYDLYFNDQDGNAGYAPWLRTTIQPPKNKK